VSFNKLVRLLTGVKFSDSQTGFKAINGVCFKRIMNVISVKRYAYDVEVLAIAELLHLRVAELPVTIDQKSMFAARHVVYMAVDLLGIVYRLRVLRWYQKNLSCPGAKYRPIIPL
jgi:hypothetical protein